MRRTQVGLSAITLAFAALMGGMLLIPAPEADSDVPQASALATSSSLSRFLGDAIDPARPLVAAPVTELAALPEPPVVSRPVLATPSAALPVTKPAPAVPAPIETALAAAVEPPVAVPASAERIPVRTPINLRSGPSTDEATLLVLPAKEEVAILERSGNWARIARNDGTTGWVFASYLGKDTAPNAATREAAAAPRVEQEAPQLASLKLRAEPSTRSRSIIQLEPGTPLKVAERRPGWVRVIMPDGLTGWVRTSN